MHTLLCEIDTCTIIMNTNNFYYPPLTVTVIDCDAVLMNSPDDTVHVYTVPFSVGVTGTCCSTALLLATDPLLSVHLNVLPVTGGLSEQLSISSLPTVS